MKKFIGYFIGFILGLFILPILLSFNKRDRQSVDTVLLRVNIQELNVIVKGVMKLPIEEAEGTLYTIRLQANQQLTPPEVADSTHKDSTIIPKKKK